MGRPTRAELLERITYNPDILDSRILVTLDNDFGDLIVRDGHPHAGLRRLVTDSV